MQSVTRMPGGDTPLKAWARALALTAPIARNPAVTLPIQISEPLARLHAIAAETRPPLRSMVLLGKVQARLVRNLDEGFALEFVHEQLVETLEDSVTAR